MNTQLSEIAEKIKGPLPGKAAQYQMAHGIRKYDLPVPDDAYIAGVLLLLYPKNNNLHTVFIERVSTRNDKHSGQMSFPGGRYERSDGPIQNTAARETEEEIGVTASQIEILGKLSELYIPVSNFLVHPYVGMINEQPSFSPQPDEVKNIVEVPISLLTDPDSKSTTSLALTRNLTLKNVPYFDVYGNIVWGATAMILNEFLELIGN